MRFRPLFEQLEARRLLASDWQNAIRIRDVDGDGAVTVLDVLQGINRLNAHLGPLPPRSAQSTEPFYDVDGDATHSPLDVLLVINALNNGPLLDVSLANDTGFGPTAKQDRLTRDVTLNGTIHGEAQQLSGRLGAKGPWVDLSKELVDGKKFVLTEETIAKLFPESLHDGDMDFYFSAKNAGTDDALADRMRVRFKADRQSPLVHTLGQIQMDRPDEILVPILEPIANGTIDASKMVLFDATAGEAPSGNGEELPLIRLTIQSAKIVDGGRKLSLKLQPLERSARYLVAFGDGAVTDAAGNAIQLSNKLMANYLDPNVPTLQFERGYRSPFASTSGNHFQEYAFELPIDDRLIWGGDRFNGLTEFNGLSEFQIVDAAGTKVWSVKSGQRVEFHPTGSTGFFPQAIPLAAGSYRLRMIETSVPGSFFWIGRESQLTEMPMSLTSIAYPQPNLDTWTLNIRRVHLVEGESILVDKGVSSTTSDVRHPLWRVITPTGEVLKKDSVEQQQGFFADTPGDYIVVLRDAPYVAKRVPPRVWEGPGTDPRWNDPPTPPVADDHTIIDRGELPKGIIDLNFVTGNEAYEFTVNASAGDEFFLEASHENRDAIVTVVDKFGSQTKLRDPSGHFNPWTVEQSGKHFVRITSATSGARFQIRLAKFNELRMLQPGINEIDELSSSSAFRFIPAKESVAFTISEGYWRLLSYNSLIESGFSAPVDLQMVVGREYVFLCESTKSITVAYPGQSTRDVLIGETISGNLEQFGASTIFEVYLEAGNRYHFADRAFSNPFNVDWHWLDSPSWAHQNYDPIFLGGPSKSWNVLQSGIYRFEVKNIYSSGWPIEYRMQLVLDNATTSNAGLEGFGIVYKGAPSPDTPPLPDKYRIQMPLGTPVYTNIILGNSDDLYLQWFTPSGVIISANSFVAPESGEYSLHVFFVPRLKDKTEYRLELVTPAMTEPLELDTYYDSPNLPNHETQFFRFNTPQPQLVYLDFQNPTADGSGVAWSSLDEFKSNFVLLDSKSTSVVMRSIQANNRNSSFAVRTFDKLKIGHQQNVDFANRSVFGFEFSIEEPGEYAINGMEHLGSLNEVQLLDTNGNIVSGLRESYNLVPGKYHVLFFRGQAGESQGSVLVQRYTRVEYPLQIGLVINDELAQKGQWKHYEIDVRVGQTLFLLSLTNGIDTRWIGPSGRSEPVFSGTKLPVARSGRYELELMSQQRNSVITFVIQDLADAQVIGLGISPIDLSTQTPFAFARFSGAGDVRISVDGQDIQLLREPEPFSIQILNHFAPWVRERVAVSVAADGELIIVLTGNLPVKLLLENYVPRTIQAKLGELIDSRSRYVFDEYVVGFQIPSDGFYIVERPQFSQIYDSRGATSNQVGVLKLTAGRYELRGDGNFVGRISSLTGDLETIPIGVSVPAKMYDTWQLELLTSGRYEFSLRGADNIPIVGDTAVITNDKGQSWVANSRAELKAGKYWLRLMDSAFNFDPTTTQYSLKVSPVEVIVKLGAIGKDLNTELSTSEPREYQVLIPYAPGQRAVLDYLRLDPGVFLEYTSGPEFGWRKWNSEAISPLINLDQLWLRFSGSGSATIRLMDWNQAAALSSGLDQSIRITNGQRWQVWKLDLSLGDNVELVISDKIPKNAYLATASFERIEEVAGSIKFSVVNRKPVYLVIGVDFESVGPLEIRYDLIVF